MYPTPVTQASIAEAAKILRGGGLVAFPTETVYGLGADATNGKAVARIFEAKGRPRFNPLIVHVLNQVEAERLVNLPPLGQKLAKAFWPGALTLVALRAENCPVSELASAGLDTLAVRVPSAPIARELIKAAGLPLAAPSANASEELSPTRAGHVMDSLGERVDMILDGGPCELGLESTVIGIMGDTPVLLRLGAIARVDIEAVVGSLEEPGGGNISSPGQLTRHYSPQAPLRLDASGPEPGEAWLGFGARGVRVDGPARNLSESGDLVEAASKLYAALRALDAENPRAIAVAPIPHEGLGEAINDRLARAAAPKAETA